MNIPFKKPKKHDGPSATPQAPANPPFKRYDTHTEMVEDINNSDIKELFTLPNSTVNSSLCANIVPSVLNLVQQHDPHTGQEGDCAKCMKVYNKYIKIGASSLERATEGQSTCMAWRDSRRARITASTANKVPKRDTTNPDKFMKEQLFPSFRGNAATKYGQEQEVKAREFFEEQFTTKVDAKGTVVCAGNEWLSASPDGIINSSEVLEIKCPHVNHLSSIIESGKYDVKKTMDGALYLATTGPRGYYMQVQLTMACCGLQACHDAAFTMSVITPKEGVEINQEVELTCAYSGGEILILNWHWQSGRDTEERRLIWTMSGGNNEASQEYANKFELIDDMSNGHGIRIKTLTTEDEGTYQCSINAIADGAFLEKIAKTDLKVLVPPEDIELSVSPEPLEAGTTATITCRIAQVWPLTDLVIEIWKGSGVVDRQESPRGTAVPGDALAHTVTVRKSMNITKRDKEVKFQCVVTWRGRDFDKSHDLEIYYPPRNLSLEMLPGGLVKEGSTSRVVCFHDGANPQPTLKLLRHRHTPSNTPSNAPSNGPSNGPIESRVVAEGMERVEYVEKEVNRTQNGVIFSCEAEGGALTGVLRAANVTLDVLFSIDSLTMTEFPSEMVREEFETSITCLTGTGNPTPRVVWQHADDPEVNEVLSEEPIPGEYGAMRLRSSYTVTAYRKINRQLYQCSLPNNPAVSQNVTLNVKFEFTSVVRGPVLPTPAGSNLALHCNSSTSNPPTSFKWLLRGVESSLMEVNTVQTAGEFYGTEAHSMAMLRGVGAEQHGSIVACTPVFDNAELKEKQQMMVLNVTYPPNVTAQVLQQPLYEKTMLIVQCVILHQGNPPVYGYHWYRGETEIEDSEGAELQVPDVQAEDAGVYRCQASNHGGFSNMADINVQVHYSPREVYESASNLVYAELGQQVQLNLTVRTFPPPSACTWTLKQPEGNIRNMPRENINIQPVDNSQDDRHLCTLLVPPIEVSSYGTYNAAVSNNAGTLFVSFLLKPFGPPGPPVAVTVTSDPNEEQFTIQWLAGQNGGHPQTFSVFRRPVLAESSAEDDEEEDEEEEEEVEAEWTLSKSDIPDPGLGKQIQHDISVKGEEYMEYEFMVTSVNKLGRMDSAVVRGQTVTAPIFNGNYTYSLLGGSTLIHWSPIPGGHLYDEIRLRHCTEHGVSCTEYDVTGRDEFQVEQQEGAAGGGEEAEEVGTFQLVVIHTGREIAESPVFVLAAATGPDSGSPAAATASIAVGVVVAIIVLIAVVLLAILFMRRKRKAQARARSTNPGDGSTHSGSYVAIASHETAAADNVQDIDSSTADSPYDEVVVRSPIKATQKNGSSAASPDIVSSHTSNPQAAPRKRRQESDPVDNPRGLSVSIPPMSPHGLDPSYENVRINNGPNQDSVIYAKLDLPDVPEGETPRIHGNQEKTEYVAIDFTRPLAPHDSDSD